jgi:hypothetical protein
MIKTDATLAESVDAVFTDCFNRDKSVTGRFNPEDPEDYIASFEDYAADYDPLKSFGIRILRPDEVEYPLKRNGDCVVFTLHKLGLPVDDDKEVSELVEKILKLPDSDEPMEDSIVVYCPTAWEFGGASHIGLYRNGKVISKWGPGPIFEHGISATPYGMNKVIGTSYGRDGSKESSKIVIPQRIIFKLPGKLPPLP